MASKSSPIAFSDGRVATVAAPTDVVDSYDEPGYSFTAPSLLMALWRPTIPEAPGDPDGRYFEGVLIAPPGYYGV